MIRKVFVLHDKTTNNITTYSTLVELCKNDIGVSKGTLDRFNFDGSDYENERFRVLKRYTKQKRKK